MTPWKQELERKLAEPGVPAALPFTALARAAWGAVDDEPDVLSAALARISAAGSVANVIAIVGGTPPTCST